MNCIAVTGAKIQKIDYPMIVSEIYPDTKGVLSSNGIFFIHSRHVESCVLITRDEKSCAEMAVKKGFAGYKD